MTPKEICDIDTVEITWDKVDTVQNALVKMHQKLREFNTEGKAHSRI